MGILAKGSTGISSGFALPSPTTIVLMNGLSSSCVLASTTSPMAILANASLVVAGGQVQLVRLPMDALWQRSPIRSTPRIMFGEVAVLLCAAWGGTHSREKKEGLRLIPKALAL